MKLRPSFVDPRDRAYHFHKHFGTTFNFPDSFLIDNGTFPDQDADNRPDECTGYACTQIAGIQDKASYSPDYNFMKTLEVMNEPPNSDGADFKTAAKIGCTFGFLKAELEPQPIKDSSQAWGANQANWSLTLDSQTIKKANYLPIAPVPDYFDGVRNAIYMGNTPVGMGTEWSPDFENVGPDGILKENPSNLYWGHAYCAVGWQTIAGNPYLVIKSWQGPNYGHNGYCYMSRTLANQLMSAWGAYAFTFAEVASIPQQEFNLLDVLIALYQNLIISMKHVGLH